MVFIEGLVVGFIVGALVGVAVTCITRISGYSHKIEEAYIDGRKEGYAEAKSESGNA